MIVTKKEQKKLINTIAEATNNIGLALTMADNRAAVRSAGVSVARMMDLLIEINNAEIRQDNFEQIMEIC